MQVEAAGERNRTRRAVVIDQQRSENPHIQRRRKQPHPSSPSNGNVNVGSWHRSRETSRDPCLELTRLRVEGQTRRYPRIVVKIAEDISQWIRLTKQCPSNAVEDDLRVI